MYKRQRLLTRASRTEEMMEIDGDFSADVRNSIVFLVSNVTQIATFLANYRVCAWRRWVSGAHKGGAGILKLFVCKKTTLRTRSAAPPAVRTPCPNSPPQGAPFIIPLKQNKKMIVGLFICLSVSFAGILDLSPDLNEALDLIPVPDEDIQMEITGLFAIDIVATMAIAHVLRQAFRILPKKHDDTCGETLVLKA